MRFHVLFCGEMIFCSDAQCTASFLYFNPFDEFRGKILLPKVSSIGTSVQVTPSLRSAVFWQHWKQKLPMTGFKRLMSKMTAHCATVILSTIKLEELKSLYDLGTSNHHRDLVSSNLVTFSFCFVLKWLHSFQI